MILVTYFCYLGAADVVPLRIRRLHGKLGHILGIAAHVVLLVILSFASA
jgi:hypothetical protein